MSSGSSISANERWVYRTEQPRTPVRLFAFPYVGGSAAVFDKWQADLAGVAEVCAVELPGRRARYREPLATELPPLIDRIATGLTPLLDVPYVLFGHSFGALLAFDVARDLRRRRLPAPLAFMASAAQAPHRLRIPRRFTDLSDERFIDEIAGFGGIPAEVLDQPELLDLLVPVLRADFRLVESYRYDTGANGPAEPPLDVPLFLYGAHEDPQVEEELLRAWGELFDDVRTVELFDGGHFFCHARRAELTRAIRRDLEALLAC